MEEEREILSIDDALDKAMEYYDIAKTENKMKKISIYINDGFIRFSSYTQSGGDLFEDAIFFPKGSSTKDIMKGLLERIKSRCVDETLSRGIWASSAHKIVLGGTDNNGFDFTIDIIPNNYHLEWAKRMEARYNNPNAYPDDQEIGEVVDLLNGKIDSKEQDMTL